MRPSSRFLYITGTALAVLCAVVYWPTDDSGVPGAKLLSAEQLQKLPAGPESDRLIGHHIGCLLYGHDGVREWTDLPEAPRHVWATLCFESQTANGLTSYFRGTIIGPPLAETATGYRAMDAPDAAILVEQLAQLNGASRPRDLAAMESRLAAIRPKAAEKRHAYVIEHAEEIARRR